MATKFPRTSITTDNWSASTWGQVVNIAGGVWDASTRILSGLSIATTLQANGLAGAPFFINGTRFICQTNDATTATMTANTALADGTYVWSAYGKWDKPNKRLYSIGEGNAPYGQDAKTFHSGYNTSTFVIGGQTFTCSGGTTGYATMSADNGLASGIYTFYVKGAWVQSTKTLTPATSPNWETNTLQGATFTINGVDLICASNTQSAAIMGTDGSIANGSYEWHIKGTWSNSTKTLTPTPYKYQNLYPMPAWDTNNQTGIAFDINGTLFTCASNNTTSVTMTTNGSLPNGTYSWRAFGKWVKSTKTFTPAVSPGWGALGSASIDINGYLFTINSNDATSLTTTADNSLDDGFYEWVLFNESPPVGGDIVKLNGAQIAIDDGAFPFYTLGNKLLALQGDFIDGRTAYNGTRANLTMSGSTNYDLYISTLYQILYILDGGGTGTTTIYGNVHPNRQMNGINKYGASKLVINGDLSIGNCYLNSTAGLYVFGGGTGADITVNGSVTAGSSVGASGIYSPITNQKFTVTGNVSANGTVCHGIYLGSGTTQEVHVGGNVNGGIGNASVTAGIYSQGATTSTIYVTGNVTGGSAASPSGSQYGIYVQSGTGQTINVTGNVNGGLNSTAQGIFVNTTATSTTINVAGAVTSSVSQAISNNQTSCVTNVGTVGTPGGPVTGASGQTAITSPTVTVYGNVFGPGINATTATVTGDVTGANSSAGITGTTVTVTGNVLGGATTGSHGISGSANANINVSGNSTGNVGNGIYCGTVASTVTVGGDVTAGIGGGWGAQGNTKLYITKNIYDSLAAQGAVGAIRWTPSNALVNYIQCNSLTNTFKLYKLSSNANLIPGNILASAKIDTVTGNVSRGIHDIKAVK